MINRQQLALGLMLILLGALLLIGTIFKINIWAICWPVGLILVGAWLLLRPRMTSPGSNSDVILLGDLRRRGTWTVQDSEYWLGVVDVDMDFTEAELPEGETRMKFYGFVGDIDLFIPSTIGVTINASGFVVDADLLGRSYETFLTPVQVTSDDYANSNRRLRIDMTGFVTDIKVKRI